MNRNDLIESPSDVRPHVVLLGAGASRAAFPDGDASGKPVPLMDDLLEVVGLRSTIEQAGLEYDHRRNFEHVYSKLCANPKYADPARNIEKQVRDYFSSLRITEETTIYDHLLLSLRRKDAVFTFNWDPFLFDAYIRNAHIGSLPEIFFLHGNVRIGMCREHVGNWGDRQHRCPICSKPFDDVPLLYPVEEKKYSNDPYIKESWNAARYFLREAFVLTIFGYGAPTSDMDAVELLKSAWLERSNRKIEHIEVIDIASSSDLFRRWRDFAPTGHIEQRRSFEDSWMAMYPRRSVECLRRPVYFGEPSEIFPLVNSINLRHIHEQILDIAEWEKGDDSSQENSCNHS